MFIEEVIIDGFKSYATRTVVSGFDPAFNAITGLNGSGKSNILDSISLYSEFQIYPRFVLEACRSLFTSKARQV